MTDSTALISVLLRSNRHTLFRCHSFAASTICVTVQGTICTCAARGDCCIQERTLKSIVGNLTRGKCQANLVPQGFCSKPIGSNPQSAVSSVAPLSSSYFSSGIYGNIISLNTHKVIARKSLREVWKETIPITESLWGHNTEKLDTVHEWSPKESYHIVYYFGKTVALLNSLWR